MKPFFLYYDKFIPIPLVDSVKRKNDTALLGLNMTFVSIPHKDSSVGFLLHECLRSLLKNLAM